MTSYTTDGCLDGRTRKQQAPIDVIRLAHDLADRLDELGELSQAQQNDVAHCTIVLQSFLSKEAREELRQD